MIRRKLISNDLSGATSLSFNTLPPLDSNGSICLAHWFASTLPKALKPYNFKEGFYNLSTILTYPWRQKDPIPPWERSGVYRLQCFGCPVAHVGETGCQFLVWIQVYFDETMSAGSHWKSAFAEHIKTTGHIYDVDNGSFLHQEECWIMLE